MRPARPPADGHSLCPPRTAPDPSPSPSTADALAALLAAPVTWLQRRTDHVRFHDDVAVSRRTVVDLTVTPDMPPDASGARLVPVAVLPKQPLARFTATDEEDRPLPVLTAEENTHLAQGALRVWAAHLIGAPLPAALAVDLDAVVQAPRGGRRRLAAFWGAEGDRAARERLRVGGGGVFAAFVDALADGFLVVVALDGAPGARRVVTVRRDERIVHRPPGSAGGRLLRAVGWRPATAVLDVPAVLAGRSAHVEVEVPRGVDVERAVALCRPGGRGGAEPAVLARAGDAPHVHLHLGALAPTDEVVVLVDLHAEPHGWLAQSAWAATGVAAALVGAGWRLEVLAGPDGRADAEAASLLLGLTGLAATLLVRPREHPLATRLLAGLRWLAALPPVAAAAVAGMLVVGPGRPTLDVLWWSLAGVCATVAVVLHVARRPSPGDDPPPR